MLFSSLQNLILHIHSFPIIQTAVFTKILDANTEMKDSILILLHLQVTVYILQEEHCFKGFMCGNKKYSLVFDLHSTHLMSMGIKKIIIKIC